MPLGSMMRGEYVWGAIVSYPVCVLPGIMHIPKIAYIARVDSRVQSPVYMH